MTIQVIDVNNVNIDGVNAGQALDAVRNHPKAASDIQRALAEWWTEKKNTHAKELAVKESEHDKALKAKEDEHAAHIAEKQALIDAMGGTDVGQQLAKERAIAEAVKAKEEAVAAAIEAQNKIDDLNAAVVPDKKKVR